MDTLLGPAEILALIVLVTVSLAVFLHWLQSADIHAYRQSPLIAVEMIGLLGVFALVPVFFVRALYLLARRQLRSALVNLIICAAAAGTAAWAMWLDAATILYMT